MSGMLSALFSSIPQKLCLLSLVHCDTDVDDEDAVYLRDCLAYRMTIHIHVKGLETGYSRDVHGRVWFSCCVAIVTIYDD